MYGWLCSLNPRRRALIDDEPDMVGELFGLRRLQPIPGAFELGKAWDPIRRLIGNEGVLSDAVTGESGARVGEDLGYGPARLLEADRVKEIAAALVALPDALVASRWAEHGPMGAVDEVDADELDEDAECKALVSLVQRLRAFYVEAAAEDRAVVVVIA
ncbi:MAG: DUF1877 family protein [Myxococcota bacterium]